MKLPERFHAIYSELLGEHDRNVVVCYMKGMSIMTYVDTHPTQTHTHKLTHTRSLLPPLELP